MDRDVVEIDNLIIVRDAGKPSKVYTHLELTSPGRESSNITYTCRMPGDSYDRPQSNSGHNQQVALMG